MILFNLKFQRTLSLPPHDHLLEGNSSLMFSGIEIKGDNKWMMLIQNTSQKISY